MEPLSGWSPNTQRFEKWLPQTAGRWEGDLGPAAVISERKTVTVLQNYPVGSSKGSSFIASPAAWWGVDESILYVQGNMTELIFWLLWGQSVKILFVPYTLVYASALPLLPSTLNFPDTQGLGKNVEAPEGSKHLVLLLVGFGRSGRSLCLQPEGELEIQLCHGKEL